MTPESTPKRRRHYGWWIAGSVCTALFGLILYIWVNYGAGIQLGYSIASGNPSFPGCERTATREGEAGSLWYRAIEMRCPDNRSMSFLYVKEPEESVPFPHLAFIGINGPAAVSLRETENEGFEIVLAAPLADKRATLPVTFGENGLVAEIYTFYEGRPVDVANAINTDGQRTAKKP
jgi:hypothetical protein